MGQVDVFEILFDNSNGVYREGDRVSGNVKISNTEDVKYKGNLGFDFESTHIIWAQGILSLSEIRVLQSINGLTRN